MFQVTISNEMEHHEAWPDITMAGNSDLIVIYKESDGHLNLKYSNIVIRISKDQGKTWSARTVLYSSNDPQKTGLISSGRITSLNDNTLIVAIDRFYLSKISNGAPYLDKYMNGDTLIFTSYDFGETWGGPFVKPIKGSLSNLKQLKNGTILLGVTEFSYKRNKFMNDQVQVVYRSIDNGNNWSGPYTVLDHMEYQPSEGDFVELDNGTIVCYLRDEDFRIDLPNRTTGLKCISYDGGITWEGPYSAGRWLFNGLISAGVLKSGDIMITTRLGMGKRMPYFGYFQTEPWRKPEFIGYWCGNQSPYLYAYIETQEDAVKKTPPGIGYDIPISGSSHWMVIDNDLNQNPDYGYSSWTNLLSGEAFIVQFITDDSLPGRSQIRGYIVSDYELHNPCRDKDFSFDPSSYHDGPLAGQDDWVNFCDSNENTVIVDSNKSIILGRNVVDITENISLQETWIAPTVNIMTNKAQIIRRDIGPFNLYDEEVNICFEHKGFSEYAKIMILDEYRQSVTDIIFDLINMSIRVLFPQISKDYTYKTNGKELFYCTKLILSVENIQICTMEKDNKQNTIYICNEHIENFQILSGIALQIGGEGNFAIDNIVIEGRKV